MSIKNYERFLNVNGRQYNLSNNNFSGLDIITNANDLLIAQIASGQAGPTILRFSPNVSIEDVNEVVEGSPCYLDQIGPYPQVFINRGFFNLLTSFRFNGQCVDLLVRGINQNPDCQIPPNIPVTRIRKANLEFF